MSKSKNEKMVSLFTILAVIAGLLGVISLFGYRHYSGKVNKDREEKASSERNEIKDVIKKKDTQANKQTSPTYTEATTIKGSSVNEIYDRINDTEDLLKDQIANSFIGETVELTCTIQQIKSMPDGFVQLGCFQFENGRSNNPLFYIRVKLSKYSKLKRIKGKDLVQIQVAGTISNVSTSGYGVITINEPTKLTFL